MVTIDSSTGDIACYTGEAFTLNFYFWTDSANTVPKDMTGQTVRFTVKRTKDIDPTDANAVIKVDYVVVTPPAINLAVITVDQNGSTTGSKIVAGQYYYDVKVHPLTGANYYAYASKFSVTQSVTNR